MGTVGEEKRKGKSKRRKQTNKQTNKQTKTETNIKCPESIQNIRNIRVPVSQVFFTNY
jgi:hypothetical protein